MYRKIYIDLSVLQQTSTGAAIYAWELCHRLMRFCKPLQVVPLKSPFKTIGKTGLSRSFNAILRDTIWQNFFLEQNLSEEDYIIFPTQFFIPKKIYQRKYAVVCLDLSPLHNPSNFTWRGRMSAKSLPECLNHADRIFAISEYTAQDIVNILGIPQEKIFIAPCGISEIYKSQAPLIEKVNEVFLPDKYFLHVGSWQPTKNLNFLLKVYERFCEITANSKNPIRLVLTGGESWKASDFVKAIQDSPYADNIIVLGNIDSKYLPSLYKSALAFVFPSIFEGFGIPVIEALSQGTPVLINSNSSLSQFDEFGATVFNHFDIDIWACALQDIADQQKKIDLTYITKIINYYDWDRTAKIVANSLGVPT